MLYPAILEQIFDINSSGNIIEKANKNNITLEKIVDGLKSLINPMINFGLSILIALIIFWIGKFVIKQILKTSQHFMSRSNLEEGVSKFLTSLIRAICYCFLIIILLETVGIKTTSFVAVLGTASLAIGLSIQGSLANFAGGVLILVIKPFKIGDYIIEHSGNKEGTVSRIDLFYTTLITPDNKKIVVPNGTLANSSLTNVSSYDKRRADFTVGISYNADIKKAKEIILSTVKDNEFVLIDEPIEIFVENLGSSEVVIGFRAWTKNADYWDLKHSLLEEVKIKLDEGLIEIPYNQLVVHMNSESK